MLVILGIALASGGIGSGLLSGVEQSSPEIIRVGYVPIPHNTLTILALRNGYFEEQGIRVQETKASFIGHVFQALVQNQLDVLVGGETPGVFMALKKGSFFITGQAADAHEDFTLLSKRDSGIKTLADLEGKQVGLAVTSVSHYNLWQVLKREGMNPAQVEFVDVNPPNMAAALEKGEVDAIFQWKPLPFKIQKSLGEKVNAIVPSSRWLVLVYASPEFAQKEESLEKVFLGLKKAENFLLENPSEAAQIVAPEVGLTPVELEVIWQGMTFEVVPFNEKQLLEAQAAWAMESGLVEEMLVPDFDSLIDNKAVEGALSLTH